MSSEEYIGLDVHQATISVAVMDSSGTTARRVRQCSTATRKILSMDRGWRSNTPVDAKECP